jgi:hypothetical protein
VAWVKSGTYKNVFTELQWKSLCCIEHVHKDAKPRLLHELVVKKYAKVYQTGTNERDEALSRIIHMFKKIESVNF